MLTVFLADDHQVVLDGFKSLLRGEAGLRVIGETTDGLAVAGAVAVAAPDVLLLDLMMPGMNGLEVIQKVRGRSPMVKIVILSMHAELPYVSKALRHGASAYVLKQGPAHQVITALYTVMRGECYLSPPLSEEALGRFEARAAPRAREPYDALTGREREVLQLAAEGLSNDEIGGRLGIGRRTVETHRANLMRKLGLSSHAHLVRFAVGRGLLAAFPAPRRLRI
jgi:DNA-binding NarL/FixJ family response regulator